MSSRYYPGDELRVTTADPQFISLAIGGRMRIEERPESSLRIGNDGQVKLYGSEIRR